MIPYGKQSITEEDIQQVIKVLSSDWLTQGPTVPQFERLISRKVGAKHCVCSTSATSALHLAYLALGLGKGDYLWTSPNTFLSTATSAIHCGAEVDFVDIDQNSYNMSVQSLQDKLEKAAKEGTLPKIVVPVHYAGQSCEMQEIHRLAQLYGFSIVEDASHAIGGRYGGEMIGCCKHSDITVFSFHPVKIITTGEGGAATTNNQKLAEAMSLLRSHGITRKTNEEFQCPPDEIWNYQQINLGFNYRMTDIQAGLGIGQLDKLHDHVLSRTKIAEYYNCNLTMAELKLPAQHIDTQSSFHLYPVRVKADKNKKSQKAFYEFLLNEQIGVNLHYIPVYRHPFFRKLGFKAGYCPEAENYFHETLSLPIFPSLKMEQQTYIVEKIKSYFEGD